MSDPAPIATHAHQPGQLGDTLEFLKRIRSELSQTRRVQVATDWVRIFDVNSNCFEVTQLGYADEDVIPVLEAVNTVFRPESIHQPIARAYKEFKTGKRRCWAEDRLM
jgi:hypothetical protein